MNIKNYSPLLQTMSGDIEVDDIDYRRGDNQVIKLINCFFNMKPGVTRYKNINGFKADLFEAIKPQLDVMMDSYMRGMTLAPHNHSWVQDSIGKPFEEWAESKGIKNEFTEQKSINKK
jgi:hypothetical protein